MEQEPVAIVTGAGGGLGAAMTAALADAGLRVAAVDVNAAALSGLERDKPGRAARILPLAADIRSPAACADAVGRAVKRFGRLDMLVNNAGVGLSSIREDYYVDNVMFWEVPDERWDAIIDVNVKGAFLMAKAALPALREGGRGRIVNVTTSMDTMIRRGWTPYGPSKAALEACSAIWAKDLEGTGVTVNVLVPGGPADTGMVPPASAPDRASLVPPGVMKAPVRWLASRDSDGFTGRRIVAARWDDAVPGAEAARAASWPAAWPGVGAGAIVSGTNPMAGASGDARGARE